MNNQEIDEKVSVLKSLLIKSSAVLGIALLVGAAYLGYQSHLESKNQAAADLFYKAFEMELAAVSESKTPEESGQMQSFDAEKIVAWEPAKLDSYLKILAEVGVKYSGTPTWALSQIRIAKIKFVQGSVAEAEKIYANVISTMKRSPLYFGLASDALGVLLENQGQNDKAHTVFREAAAELKNPLRPLAMLGEARTLNALGKTGAVDIFDKIVKEFPETAYSRRAKVLRSTVQAGAR